MNSPVLVLGSEKAGEGVSASSKLGGKQRGACCRIKSGEIEGQGYAERLACINIRAIRCSGHGKVQGTVVQGKASGTCCGGICSAQGNTVLAGSAEKAGEIRNGGGCPQGDGTSQDGKQGGYRFNLHAV